MTWASTHCAVAQGTSMTEYPSQTSEFEVMAARSLVSRSAPSGGLSSVTLEPGCESAKFLTAASAPYAVTMSGRQRKWISPAGLAAAACACGVVAVVAAAACVGVGAAVVGAAAVVGVAAAVGAAAAGCVGAVVG